LTEANQQAGEIDLLTLIRSIIATKTHVLGAMLVVSAVFWGLTSLGNLAFPPIKTASINFYFTFKGAEQSQYPNETPFDQSDVIAPVVLNKVYDITGAKAYLSRDVFVSGFSILPYIPDIDLINAKYDLDVKGLSQAELERLQQQLLREIRQASLLAGKLEFTTKDPSIPSELIATALKTVPKVWADHMINNVGVSEFDVTLYSEKIIDASLVSGTNNLVAFELILDKINVLKQNIEEIMALPNGKVATDPDTGLTAPDLLKALEDMEDFAVDPLLSSLRHLNISEETELVEFFFSDKLEELKREEQLAKNKLENLKSAYGAYVNNQTRERNDEQGQNTAGNSNSVIPQFGTEFLDRLVTLTSAGADIAFRQELTEQLVELGDELAQIEREVARVESALKAARKDSGAADELTDLYRDKAKKEIPNILERLSGYFTITSRIYSVVNENALGSGGMFRFVSDQVQFRVSKSILNSYNIRNYLIFLFLAVIVVIPVSMTYRALRQSPEQT
jgi:hypothetical protein